MVEWQMVKLGDCVDITSSKRIFASEYMPSGIPFYRGKEVIEKAKGNKVSIELYISIDRYEEIKEKFGAPKEGEMLLTSVGTLGVPYIITKNEKFYFKDGNLTWFRNFRGLHNQFLKYWLISDIGKEEIKRITIGSTQQAITISALNNLNIVLPQLNEQQAITAVLSALDKKIELNQHMNKTLESIAQALFKSWFVDFDPVKAKAEGHKPEGMDDATASLFPARFHDGIPEGWSIKSVSEAIKLNPPEKLPNGMKAPYLEMAALPTRGCIPDPPVLRVFSSGTKFRNGDTLLARITPCLENGKTAYIAYLQDDQVAWGSTEFIVMRAKSPLPAEYTYLLARDQNFRAHAIQSMTGTSGRQRVQADALGTYEICIPTDRVAQKFGQILQPLFMKIVALSRESNTLSQLRDTLLPRLISGKLRVDEISEIVEALAS